MGPTARSLDEALVRAFGAALRGGLLRPGDPAYEAARSVWNAAIDRRPALIARCAGAADVIRAVDFARANDLLVSVRGGGHSVAGFAVCDDGLMIDLSGMKGIRVDPASRAVRAEPGVTCGGVRPRDPGLRPGDHRRLRALDGDRRAHPGRRLRLPDASLRPDLRQPPVGRSGHGRRPAPEGQRDRERGPFLGHPGRRGQLRRRHLLRVPTPSGGADRPRGAHRAPAVGGARCHEVLPRVRADRTGRADDPTRLGDHARR